jgi:hypothetical protein
MKMCLNETYSTVRICKYQFHKFPVQNGLKLGDALSPLLSNFALENAIRHVQEKGECLKLIGKHHFQSYADEVNIVRGNTGTVKKNTEALLNASKGFRLEVNPEKTQYMLMSRSQKI